MSNLKQEIFRRLEQKESRIKEIRRYLHQHPELSFEETETSQYIKDFYKDKDVTLHTDLNGKNGLVVEIKGAKPGKTIALRADFDALPIQEDSGVEFSSQNDGVMHACGHDAHTAYLLVVAETLIEVKDQLPGTVKIIHQHAEEVPPGGAQDIIASGVLNDIDEVYGIHFLPSLAVGTVHIRKGAAFAGRSNFELQIDGKGGHAAMPQNAHDPLVAGSHFVTQVQTVVSRRMDPLETAVVTVSAFEAPGGFNVIQDSVTLRGTVRYMNEALKEPLYNEINRLVQGLEQSFNVKTTLDYKYDYPVLNNSEEQTEAIAQLLKDTEDDYVNAVVDTGPITASEDFAYYLTNKPGAFIVVGAKPQSIEQEVYPLHHPKLVLNEEAFIVAAKTIVEVTLSRLSQD